MSNKDYYGGGQQQYYPPAGRLLPPTTSGCISGRVPTALRSTSTWLRPALPAPTSSSDSICVSAARAGALSVRGVADIHPCGNVSVLLRRR
ncbi:hypothetical protein C8Q73DRAFT_173053 [Cubamyces lactineus]|nr:hypothetical protein C8Q73DRAFT_173053 [Cubamyces lactineus]